MTRWIPRAKQGHFKKVICTPGCASFEIRTPHPQHPPPLAESTWNLHKPQHPSTGHPIAFGLGFGLGFGSGGRGQAPRPKPTYICILCMCPVLYTWYQAFRFSSSSSSTFHRIYTGAFQSRTPGCAYNTTRIYVVVLITHLFVSAFLNLEPTGLHESMT